jgi:hypothetical protein
VVELISDIDDAGRNEEEENDADVDVKVKVKMEEPGV